MIVSARGGERARILSWPRPYAQNPYLRRLADALAAQRVSTVTDRYLAQLALRPARASWLHVHWPEWMLRDTSRARSVARAAWFFAWVDTFRARGIRVAWTAHNLLGHDEPHRDLAVRHRRAWLRRCDLVIGHFPSAEGAVRELGFRGTFAWAPHPHFIDEYPAADEPSDESRSALRASIGVGEAERLVVAFGAFEPYKGLGSLVREFRASARDDEHLAIVGSPSNEETVREVQREAAGARRVVVRPGFVEAAEAPRWFHAADVASCAYTEFFTSGVAMLALSFGCPVMGPSRHHLATFADQPFFVAYEPGGNLRFALDRVRSLGSEARSAAVAYASTCTWERMGRVVAGAMFPEWGSA